MFTSNGNTPIQTTIDNMGIGGIDPLQADKAEASLKSLCKTIQNTIHAFGWQHNQRIYPEKIFFSEIRDMDINTNAFLQSYLGIPVERISVRGDKRVRMEDYLSRVWNSPLMDRALALALRDNKKGRGFNFRKGEFEVTNRYVGFKKEIRKIGIFLGIVLLFLIIDLGMDYHLLKKQYETSDQRIVELYRQVFPNEKKVLRPLDQMRIKVNGVKNSAVSLPGIKVDHKIVDLLKDISERIPTSLDVRVTNVVIDQATARMSGETDTFNTVDGIKSGLESSDYFSNVTISSAKLDRSGKRVQFEMKLERTNQ
jgi:Tfp pilus assembly protein PilN